MKKIVLILLSLLLCFTCSACGALNLYNTLCRIEEAKYYSNKENFVPVKAICDEIFINESYPDRYYINVGDIEYERKGNDIFNDSTFEICETNAEIVREYGIEEKLSSGDEFTLISAPRFFGNGYIYPIVGLEIDGEVLLDFETGYANLMANYLQKLRGF